MIESNNEKFRQLRGPFNANQDLINEILDENKRYVRHLGIQARDKTKCVINNKIIEIGKTDILEYNNVQITSLYFLKDQPETTIIDIILY